MPNKVSTTNKSMARLHRLARFLDSSIPLPGGFRMGWDGIIGLIPGIGDLFGGLLSTYIVAEGVRLGAPLSVVARMVFNVFVELLFGTIPFLGDLFDIVFKANIRNVALLEAYTQQPVKISRRSRALFYVVTLLGIFLSLAALWLTWSLIGFVWSAIIG